MQVDVDPVGIDGKSPGSSRCVPRLDVVDNPRAGAAARNGATVEAVSGLPVAVRSVIEELGGREDTVG